MENQIGGDFLKKKYDLHNAPEVGSAVRSVEQSGHRVSGDPTARIEAYLNRLESLAMNKDKKGDSRPLSLLREMVMDKYVRRHEEKMAKGAAAVEERAARQMGIDVRYGERELQERGKIAVKDLENSLDNWINYLSDPNEPYPTWFRYYTFRSVLSLGTFDKDKGEFPARSAGTNLLFPDIDREALAHMQDMIASACDNNVLNRFREAQIKTETPQNQLLTKEKAQNFASLPFAKQYAEAISQAGEITPEMRAESRGEWKKYRQNSDPTALWQSIQNKGIPWCTAGLGTAETQLKGGDFYVYYTLDKNGKPSIPRIAIRMQGDSVGEMRGVADKDQNLEGNMTSIGEKKLNTLPGAERYHKATSDMKLLTNIEKKTQKNEGLIQSELVFLYEINGQIEGFGYQRDPRIKELRDKRNPKVDAPVVLGCRPNEIAWNRNGVDGNTKAYVGPLFPGIFTAFKSIDQIYTSFPEGQIRRDAVGAGGKSVAELERTLKQNKIQVSEYAESMMRKPEFVTLKSREVIDLVHLKVSDLGFTDSPTTDQIYEAAKRFGLELCPPEVGPELRLKYKDQLGGWKYVAMKQITDSVGNPDVFELFRGEDRAWLHDRWAGPAYRWSLDCQFGFRLRK